MARRLPSGFHASAVTVYSDGTSFAPTSSQSSVWELKLYTKNLLKLPTTQLSPLGLKVAQVKSFTLGTPQ